MGANAEYSGVSGKGGWCACCSHSLGPDSIFAGPILTLCGRFSLPSVPFSVFPHAFCLDLEGVQILWGLIYYFAATFGVCSGSFVPLGARSG